MVLLYQGNSLYKFPNLETYEAQSLWEPIAHASYEHFNYPPTRNEVLHGLFHQLLAPVPPFDPIFVPAGIIPQASAGRHCCHGGTTSFMVLRLMVT